MTFARRCGSYLFVFVLSVKGTLLLALLAGDWRSVAFLRVCTPLALAADERSDGVAVLAGRRLAVGLDVLLAFFTYGARVALSVERESKRSGNG